MKFKTRKLKTSPSLSSQGPATRGWENRRYAIAPLLLPGLLLCLEILLGANAFARTDDFQKPIDVKADRSEYDEKAGLQSLIGNVRISQGTMRITADRITVTLKDNKLSIIEGEGSPIEFQQENDLGELVTGRCNSIIYDAANGRLTLSGDATLSEPKQNLRSDNIVFDSRTQTVIAEGGETGQVSITIQPPDQNTTGQNK